MNEYTTGPVVKSILWDNLILRSDSVLALRHEGDQIEVILKGATLTTPGTLQDMAQMYDMLFGTHFNEED